MFVTVCVNRRGSATTELRGEPDEQKICAIRVGKGYVLLSYCWECSLFSIWSRSRWGIEQQTCALWDGGLVLNTSIVGGRSHTRSGLSRVNRIFVP